MDNKENYTSREESQLKECKHNPDGNFNDSVKKAEGYISTDLSTKWLGILTVIILLVSIIFLDDF